MGEAVERINQESLDLQNNEIFSIMTAEKERESEADFFVASMARARAYGSCVEGRMSLHLQGVHVCSGLSISSDNSSGIEIGGGAKEVTCWLTSSAY